MLGPTASEKKIELCSESMSLFLDVRKSIQDMRIRRVHRQAEYSEGFLASATKISDYIWKKIKNFVREKPVPAVYDPDFWYQSQINEKKWAGAPSRYCEAGTGQVYSYLVANQRFVVEVKEKIVLDENFEEEDDEDGLETDDEDVDVLAAD